MFSELVFRNNVMSIYLIFYDSKNCINFVYNVGCDDYESMIPSKRDTSIGISKSQVADPKEFSFMVKILKIV